MTASQQLWTSTPEGNHGLASQISCGIDEAHVSLDYFSPRWAEYTGHNMEEVANLTPECNPFHPEDLPASLKAWYLCLATGDPFRCEVRFKRHDGAWRWFQGGAMPLRDADGRILKWFGSYTDIHDVRLFLIYSP